MTPKQPAAPPVYRPQPMTTQLKPGVAAKAPIRLPAPPVYCPQRMLIQARTRVVQMAVAPVVAPVVAVRVAGDPVTAGTPIAFSAHCTNHGHTIAEVRAQLQAQWGNRTLRANGSRSVSWGVGAPSGIIFWDNGASITITHAQSGANIAAQAALAAANAGRADASANWRR